MTRPTRWKVLYAVALAALGLAAFTLVTVGRFDTALLIFLAVLLLIPGRINGRLWRSFYTGRRLLDAGNYEDARSEFERFLVRIRERPALKSLVWFVWAVYTRDVEAMTLNNIGAALLNQGHLESAEQYLEKAVRLDPDYPIPHYNLALVEELRGNRTIAAQSLATAQSLGYRNTSIDKVISEAASIFAYLEGRRAATPGKG